MTATDAQPGTPATLANTVGVEILGLGWKLKWEKFGKRSEVAAGGSTTKVYRTADAPATTTLFETLLHLGCNAASGWGANPADTEQTLVDTIWAEFADRDVRRVDGQRMIYWLTGNPTQELFRLLESPNGDGSCKAWAELLAEIFGAQGVPGANVVQIRTTHINQTAWGQLPDQQQGEPGLMLVRSWNFVGNGSAVAPICPECSFLVSPPTNPPEVSPGTREPAQGNNNSPNNFFNHFIVRLNGLHYDPSYGNGPFSSLSGEEDSAFAGYAVGCTDAQNLLVLIAKQNDPIVQEIQIVP